MCWGVKATSDRYRALQARDSRFDGVFFVGVKSTGIYCRPVCVARTPRADRCVFYDSAAECERDGFRACLRCRPELAPGHSSVDAVSRLVESAVRRIEAGALNDGSVETLAAELGVTDRHLRRAVVEQLGVSPIELAQTGRLAFAKRLLHDSSLGLADLALASGFQSVRRFNAAFRARFGRAPSALRRSIGEAAPSESLTLRLDFRPPLAWQTLLRFLAGRAIPGVEVVTETSYARSVSLGGKQGWVSVERDAHRPALRATVSMSLIGVLMPLVARLRRLFDLDAHPADIDRVLGADRLFAKRVKLMPGLRVPGAFDGFEVGVRAVLGQQVTVKGATTIAGRLVQKLGTPMKQPHGGLTHLFPTAARLASARIDEVASLGMPGKRAHALIGLGAAVVNGLSLEPGAPLEPLRELAGFGEWTTQYIAMRALGVPDAFPAADLGILHALKVEKPKVALAMSEAWKPWRSYAVMHVWHLSSEGENP